MLEETAKTENERRREYDEVKYEGEGKTDNEGKNEEERKKQNRQMQKIRNRVQPLTSETPLSFHAVRPALNVTEVESGC